MFYVSLLEQNIIKKEQMNKFLPIFEFEIGNNKKYKVEAIWNNAIYSKEVGRLLPEPYNLIS